ncbi:MAG TPA: chemotaxis protein CheB [Cyclobacteriaceae bacterium]|nr:chemotaxis protein CheB [Cyclobacteriaceae bacterium]
MDDRSNYGAVVIGTSAGGLNALTQLLTALPYDFPLPVMIVQHRSKDERGLLEEVLQEKCKIEVRQANEKEPISGETVYIAPPDYHLLVERDRTFSLTTDAKVNFSRPSIDVLFETAAEVYRSKLVGIILTGANDDGSNGIKMIRNFNGFTIAQDPKEAEFPAMPLAAIKTGSIQSILNLTNITNFLLSQVTARP